MLEASSDLVVMGRISGIHGVRGWVKVFSYTEPRKSILDYSPWLLQIGDQWTPFTIDQGRQHGKGVVAHLETCKDRDDARELIGADIAVHRDQFPDFLEIVYDG